MRSDRVVTYWFPVDAHPERGSNRPWYRSGPHGLVYRADGHPLGASATPWFGAVGELVFATAHHPEGQVSEPWYRVTGSFAYPAEPPTGQSPLYQFRDYQTDEPRR